jgi:YgiT-type zinc finger domain-containing protein
MKCPTCDVKTQRANAEVVRTVGANTFVGEVPASTCPNCSEVYYDGQALGRFELEIACYLAEGGMVSGPAFKFMRRALGMRAVELAEMLDVAAETISRWETDDRAVDRAAWVALSGLVADRIEGRDRVIGILRAIREPRKQPRNIRIDARTNRRGTK